MFRIAYLSLFVLWVWCAIATIQYMIVAALPSQNVEHVSSISTVQYVSDGALQSLGSSPSNHNMALLVFAG